MVAHSAISKLADPAKLAAFCAANGIRGIRIFGSFARGDQTPESDIDILLEFTAGSDPDLFELGGMQQDLCEIFNREVDLKIPDMFSPHNLERVVSNSVIAFAA
ncbi:MAG: nucleotidyltransferase family protein [Phycisphaeraceae bacterium]|nr:nucleotidyltransferase family protein [Phycisphaeraceae bacterium]